MSATCYFSGRLGNIFYHIAMLLAYCKKYDLPYYIPNEAVAYKRFRNGDIRSPFNIPSTSTPPVNPINYHEPNKDTHPYYHEIPKMDNVKFWGYWQSTKYFDWCRDYIIQSFNLPYQKEEITSVSVRRGDCVGSRAFPIAPRTYYQAAIKYMQDKGFNKFRLYSDDIPWCKEEFVAANYLEAQFEFSEGKSEMEDYISLISCENQITARSTFSLSGAWLNQNPTKIVCVPTWRHRWWNSQNHDLLPEYFTQIDFEETQLY